MAKGFNLTAELNLRGPSNIRNVVSNIRRQLGTVNANITPTISNGDIRTIATTLRSRLSGTSIPVSVTLNRSSVQNISRDIRSRLSAIDIPVGVRINRSSLAAARRDITSQLGRINASVTVNINAATVRTAGALNTNLTALNNTLGQTAQTATNAATAVRDLAGAMRAVAGINLPTNINVGLNNTNRAATNLTGAMRNAGGEMENFGHQAGLAIRRFAAFSTVTSVFYGIARSVQSGIAAFIEFDRELVRISQVTGDSRANVAALASTVDSLAKTYGVSSKELVGVSVTLAQAGLSARDTEKALKALALSALAPSFDNLNDTVEGSIALMRQFGISTNDLEKALGSVNAVAAKFAVEASDIIAAIQRTGGVFAAASRGVSEGTDALNEFVAVFTSVRATTRESAETIATGLRTIFTRIQRGSTIEALKEFGVNLTDAEGKFVGAYKAVELLSKGLRTLDPRDLRFSQIVEELGGFRQIGKVIPLIQEFATAQQALKVAQSGSGSLSADAAKGQLALAVQIAKVREEFLSLIRSIGESSSFKTFIKLGLDLASSLIKVADAAKELIPLIGIFAAIRGAQGITRFASGFTSGVRGTPRGFASGGTVESVPVALTPGETVIAPDVARSIGGSRLRRINQADRLGRRGFAKGGYAQVPGSGNTDSYYTTLPVGSFVVRKDATAFLGGPKGVMKAAGYNAGGSVQKLAGGKYVKATIGQLRLSTGGSRIVPNKLMQSTDSAGSFVDYQTINMGPSDFEQMFKNVIKEKIKTKQLLNRYSNNEKNVIKIKRARGFGDFSPIMDNKGDNPTKGLAFERFIRQRYPRLRPRSGRGGLNTLLFSPLDFAEGDAKFASTTTAQYYYQPKGQLDILSKRLRFQNRGNNLKWTEKTPESRRLFPTKVFLPPPGIKEQFDNWYMNRVNSELNKLNERVAATPVLSQTRSRKNIGGSIQGFAGGGGAKRQLGMMVGKSANGKSSYWRFAPGEEGIIQVIENERVVAHAPEKIAFQILKNRKRGGRSGSPFELQESPTLGSWSRGFYNGGKVQKLMAGEAVKPRIISPADLVGGPGGIERSVWSRMTTQALSAKGLRLDANNNIIFSNGEKLPLKKALSDNPNAQVRNLLANAGIQPGELRSVFTQMYGGQRAGIVEGTRNRTPSETFSAKSQRLLFGAAGMFGRRFSPRPLSLKQSDGLKKDTNAVVFGAVLDRDNIERQRRLQERQQRINNINSRRAAMGKSPLEDIGMIPTAAAPTAEKLTKSFQRSAAAAVGKQNKQLAADTVSAIAANLSPGTGGSRIFLDFDRTLAFGADRIGGKKQKGKPKDFSAFSDLQQIAEGLSGARLSPLGARLIKLVNSLNTKDNGLGNELLRRMFVVSARPPRTIPLIARWLRTRGLRIPPGNFSGVGGPGVGPSGIGLAKAEKMVNLGAGPSSVFIDDDVKNIAAAREKGIPSIRYGFKIDKKDPVARQQAATEEGYQFEKYVNENLPANLKRAFFNPEGTGIDFPFGLDPKTAKYWFNDSRLVGVPVDTKRTLTGPSTVKSNIISYLKERGYNSGGLVQKLVGGGFSMDDASWGKTLEELRTKHGLISDEQYWAMSDAERAKYDDMVGERAFTVAGRGRPKGSGKKIREPRLKKTSLALTMSAAGYNRGRRAPPGQMEKALEAYMRDPEYQKAMGARTSSTFDKLGGPLANFRKSGGQTSLAGVLSAAEAAKIKEALPGYIQSLQENKVKQDKAKRALENFDSFIGGAQASKPGHATAFAETINGMLKSGFVRGFAKGGSVEDTIPALLSSGEFVINKRAASTIGSIGLEKLNKADKISGFNNGGAVGHVPQYAGGGSVQRLFFGGGASARPGVNANLQNLMIGGGEVNALREMANALNEMGIAASSSADLVRRGGRASVQAAQTAYAADIQRMRIAGAPMQTVIEAETRLANMRQNASQQVRAQRQLSNIGGATLQNVDADARRRMQRSIARAQAAGVDIDENFMRRTENRSYRRAAAAGGIGTMTTGLRGGDIRQFIESAMGDPRTFTQMNRAFEQNRRIELLNQINAERGATTNRREILERAREAARLARQEADARRQTLNQVRGAGGPGGGRGQMVQQGMFGASFILPMLAQMVGGDPNKAGTASSAAGAAAIQGAANTGAMGLMFASMVPPGLGQALALVGTAAAAAGQAFIDSKNAVMEFEKNMAAKKIENAMEDIGKLFDKLSKDIKAVDVQKAIADKLIEAGNIATKTIEMESRTAKTFWINLIDVLSTPQKGANERSKILDKYGTGAYLKSTAFGQNPLGMVANASLLGLPDLISKAITGKSMFAGSERIASSNRASYIQQMIPDQAREMSKQYAQIADNTNRLIEEKIRSGVKIDEYIKTDEFKNLSTALAMANSAIAEQVLRIRNNNALSDDQKRAQEAIIVSSYAEAETRKRAAVVTRELEMREAQKVTAILSRSLERMFQNMEQSINKTSFALEKMSRDLDLVSASLTGQAKVGQGSLRSVNILQNPRAYSNTEVGAARNQAAGFFSGNENIMRGLLTLGDDIEATIMSTINKTVKDTQDKSPATIAIAIEKSVKDKLASLALPDNISDKLAREVKAALEDIRKEGDNKADFTQIEEKVKQLSTVFDSAKRAQEVAIKALEFWNNSLNEYSNSMNSLIDLQIENSQRLRKSLEILIDSQLNLGKALGKETDVKDIVQRRDRLTRQQTGGLTSPNDIFNNFNLLENRRRQQEGSAETARQQGPAGAQGFANMQRNLVDTNVALRQNYDALKNLAENSDVASAALGKIQEAQQKQQGKVSFIEKLATSTPTEVDSFNKALNRLQRNMNGQLNTINTSLGAQKAYNEAINNGATAVEAMKVAQEAFANERKETLSALNDILPFLGSGNQANQIRANTLQSMLQESGVGVSPMIADVLNSLRNPELDPETQKAIQLYTEANNLQLKANDLLTKINENLQKETTDKAAKAMADALTNVVLTFKLAEMGEKTKGLVPQAKAGGGVIYASMGMFTPKGTDTVPAMLTPGEFVVNANATAKNLPLLQNINSQKFNTGGKVKYLNKGGYVSSYFSPSSRQSSDFEQTEVPLIDFANEPIFRDDATNNHKKLFRAPLTFVREPKGGLQTPSSNISSRNLEQYVFNPIGSRLDKPINLSKLYGGNGEIVFGYAKEYFKKQPTRYGPQIISLTDPYIRTLGDGIGTTSIGSDSSVILGLDNAVDADALKTKFYQKNQLRQYKEDYLAKYQEIINKKFGWVAGNGNIKTILTSPFRFKQGFPSTLEPSMPPSSDVVGFNSKTHPELLVSSISKPELTGVPTVFATVWQTSGDTRPIYYAGTGTDAPRTKDPVQLDQLAPPRAIVGTILKGLNKEDIVAPNKIPNILENNQNIWNRISESVTMIDNDFKNMKYKKSEASRGREDLDIQLSKLYNNISPFEDISAFKDSFAYTSFKEANSISILSNDATTSQTISQYIEKLKAGLAKGQKPPDNVKFGLTNLPNGKSDVDWIKKSEFDIIPLDPPGPRKVFPYLLNMKPTELGKDFEEKVKESLRNNSDKVKISQSVVNDLFKFKLNNGKIIDIPYSATYTKYNGPLWSPEFNNFSDLPKDELKDIFLPEPTEQSIFSKLDISNNRLFSKNRPINFQAMAALPRNVPGQDIDKLIDNIKLNGDKNIQDQLIQNIKDKSTLTFKNFQTLLPLANSDRGLIFTKISDNAPNDLNIGEFLAKGIVDYAQNLQAEAKEKTGRVSDNKFATAMVGDVPRETVRVVQQLTKGALQLFGSRPIPGVTRGWFANSIRSLSGLLPRGRATNVSRLTDNIQAKNAAGIIGQVLGNAYAGVGQILPNIKNRRIFDNLKDLQELLYGGSTAFNSIFNGDTKRLAMLLPANINDNFDVASIFRSFGSVEAFNRAAGDPNAILSKDYQNLLKVQLQGSKIASVGVDGSISLNDPINSPAIDSYRKLMDLAINPYNEFSNINIRKNLFDKLITDITNAKDNYGNQYFTPNTLRFLVSSLSSLKEWYGGNGAWVGQDFLYDKTIVQDPQQRSKKFIDSLDVSQGVYDSAVVANKNLGGSAQFGDPPNKEWFQNRINAGNFATGGMVYASGGTLVNFQPRGTDTVPAMLTPGEFVVNRAATQRNLPLLQSINKATGGEISAIKSTKVGIGQSLLQEGRVLQGVQTSGIDNLTPSINNIDNNTSILANSIQQLFKNTKDIPKIKSDTDKILNNQKLIDRSLSGVSDQIKLLINATSVNPTIDNLRQFWDMIGLEIMKIITFGGASGPWGAPPFSNGGIVYASNGTLVPYSPKGTDTVPAMLTPGEFVVNASATRQNLGLLQSINNGSNGYSNGGIVYLKDGGQPGMRFSPSSFSTLVTGAGSSAMTEYNEMKQREIEKQRDELYARIMEAQKTKALRIQQLGYGIELLNSIEKGDFNNLDAKSSPPAPDALAMLTDLDIKNTITGFLSKTSNIESLNDIREKFRQEFFNLELGGDPSRLELFALQAGQILSGVGGSLGAMTMAAPAAAAAGLPTVGVGALAVEGAAGAAGYYAGTEAYDSFIGQERAKRLAILQQAFPGQSISTNLIPLIVAAPAMVRNVGNLLKGGKEGLKLAAAEFAGDTAVTLAAEGSAGISVAGLGMSLAGARGKGIEQGTKSKYDLTSPQFFDSLTPSEWKIYSEFEDPRRAPLVETYRITDMDIPKIPGMSQSFVQSVIDHTDTIKRYREQSPQFLQRILEDTGLTTEYTDRDIAIANILSGKSGALRTTPNISEQQQISNYKAQQIRDSRYVALQKIMRDSGSKDAEKIVEFLRVEGAIRQKDHDPGSAYEKILQSLESPEAQRGRWYFPANEAFSPQSLRTYFELRTGENLYRQPEGEYLDFSEMSNLQIRRLQLPASVAERYRVSHLKYLKDIEGNLAYDTIISWRGEEVKKYKSLDELASTSGAPNVEFLFPLGMLDSSEVIPQNMLLADMQMALKSRAMAEAMQQYRQKLGRALTTEEMPVAIDAVNREAAERRILWEQEKERFIIMDKIYERANKERDARQGKPPALDDFGKPVNDKQIDLGASASRLARISGDKSVAPMHSSASLLDSIKQAIGLMPAGAKDIMLKNLYRDSSKHLLSIDDSFDVNTMTGQLLSTITADGVPRTIAQISKFLGLPLDKTIPKGIRGILEQQSPYLGSWNEALQEMRFLSPINKSQTIANNDTIWHEVGHSILRRFGEDGYMRFQKKMQDNIGRIREYMIGRPDIFRSYDEKTVSTGLFYFMRRLTGSPLGNRSLEWKNLVETMDEIPLTPEQRAKIADYEQRWSNNGLNGESPQQTEDNFNSMLNEFIDIPGYPRLPLQNITSQGRLMGGMRDSAETILAIQKLFENGDLYSNLPKIRDMYDKYFGMPIFDLDLHTAREEFFTQMLENITKLDAPGLGILTELLDGTIQNSKLFDAEAFYERARNVLNQRREPTMSKMKLGPPDRLGVQEIFDMGDIEWLPRSQIGSFQERTPQLRKSGGIIYASTGKYIDFQPRGTDTVPAMLTPGEFVVNREATQQHLPLLQAINSGKGYSDGGVIYRAIGGEVPVQDQQKDMEYHNTSRVKFQRMWKDRNKTQQEAVKRDDTGTVWVFYKKDNANTPNRYLLKDGNKPSKNTYTTNYDNLANIDTYKIFTVRAKNKQKAKEKIEAYAATGDGPAAFRNNPLGGGKLPEEIKIIEAKTLINKETVKQNRKSFLEKMLDELSYQIQVFGEDSYQAFNPGNNKNFHNPNVDKDTYIKPLIDMATAWGNDPVKKQLGMPIFIQKVKRITDRNYLLETVMKQYFANIAFYDKNLKSYQNRQMKANNNDPITLNNIDQKWSKIDLGKALELYRESFKDISPIKINKMEADAAKNELTAGLQIIKDLEQNANTQNAMKDPTLLQAVNQKPAWDIPTSTFEQAAPPFNGPQRLATGGLVYASNGQLINFQPRGTDTVPAMLTPGEFVVNRAATQKHLPLLKQINSGYMNNGGVVYAQQGTRRPVARPMDTSSNAEFDETYKKAQRAKEEYKYAWKRLGLEAHASRIPDNRRIFESDDKGNMVDIIDLPHNLIKGIAIDDIMYNKDRLLSMPVEKRDATIAFIMDAVNQAMGRGNRDDIIDAMSEMVACMNRSTPQAEYLSVDDIQALKEKQNTPKTLSPEQLDKFTFRNKTGGVLAYGYTSQINMRDALEDSTIRIRIIDPATGKGLFDKENLSVASLEGYKPTTEMLDMNASFERYPKYETFKLSELDPKQFKQVIDAYYKNNFQNWPSGIDPESAVYKRPSFAPTSPIFNKGDRIKPGPEWNKGLNGPIPPGTGTIIEGPIQPSNPSQEAYYKVRWNRLGTKVYQYPVSQLMLAEEFKKAQGFQKGGIIYANSGMMVPYQPRGTDTVPAMLTPGEFVVNREATQRNLPLLRSINKSKGGIINNSEISYFKDGDIVAKRRQNLRKKYEEEMDRRREEYEEEMANRRSQRERTMMLRRNAYASGAPIAQIARINAPAEAPQANNAVSSIVRVLQNGAQTINQIFQSLGNGNVNTRQMGQNNGQNIPVLNNSIFSTATAELSNSLGQLSQLTQALQQNTQSINQALTSLSSAINDSVNILQQNKPNTQISSSGVSNSVNPVATIETLGNKLDQFIEKLQNALPSKIEVSGKHDVNVVVNGASVLQSLLGSSIGTLVEAAIKKAFAEKNRKSEGSY